MSQSQRCRRILSSSLAEVTYATLRTRLQADGHPVSIFGLPGGGLGDISATAAALADHVAAVLATTGASKVDLIGHSQGGIVARTFITFGGGAANVDSRGRRSSSGSTPATRASATSSTPT